MALSAIKPTGVFSAWIMPAENSAGTGITGAIDALPGSANPPIIFEPGSILTGGDLEVWIITSGGVDWGGCQVHVSLDGTTYASIGYIVAGAVQGVLTDTFPSGADPDTVNTLSVDLTMSRAQILSGTTSDADFKLQTLAYCDGELIAFSAATLTAAYNYDLDTYIRRGCYTTVAGSHASGTKFAWIQSPFAYEYPETLIGMTVYFKFPSFNTLGAQLQDLDDCVEYPYTLVGFSSNDPATVDRGFWHAAARVATTGPLPANTYNNGTAGVGATLTGTSNGFIGTIDGVTMEILNRVIVKNEASLAHNGVFYFYSVGDGSNPYILKRVWDYDEESEMEEGAAFPVLEGIVNGGTIWMQETYSPINIGTTGIEFIISGKDLIPEINEQTGASYTLALSDTNGIVERNNAGANTTTIPTNASAAFRIGTLISLSRTGAGISTIEADTGVTLNGISGGSCTLDTQWAGVTLYKRATDDWIIQGANSVVA